MYLHTPNFRLLDTFNAPGSVGIILITYMSKILLPSPQTSITAQLYRVIEFELSMERNYLFNHQVVNSCSKAPKAY